MSLCTWGFPAEAVEDGEVLADLFEAVEEEAPFLDVFDQLDGFVLAEVAGEDVVAAPEFEIEVGAAATETAFLDAPAGDGLEAFEDFGLNAEVVGLGVFEDIEQDFHRPIIRYKQTKINKCSVTPHKGAFHAAGPGVVIEGG